MYWWAAQALVRAGYVVMTFDPRGQGRSDLQSPTGEQGGNINSTVFYDGMVNAIDFFRSTQALIYPGNAPCAPAYPTVVDSHNPMFERLDRERIGIAGHSLGAAGVSAVQGYPASRFAFTNNQGENPVKAIVAWDALSVSADGPPRVPAMGQTSEYSIGGAPKRASPDPEGHNTAFKAWKEAGLPIYRFTIQGSTHFEWSLIPGFPTTSWCPDISSGSCLGGWGMPMAEHYTVAWMDRWLKIPGEPGYADADARLLDDAGVHGCQKFSFYSRSARRFIDRGGKLHDTADIRADCLAGKLDPPALPTSDPVTPPTETQDPSDGTDADGIVGRFGGSLGFNAMLVLFLGLLLQQPRGNPRNRPWQLWLLMCLAVAVLTMPNQVLAQAADCLGPAPEAVPNTPEWLARDTLNQYCAEQRVGDTAGNQIDEVDVPYPLRDVYREPQRFAGKRFRYDAAIAANRADVGLPVDVFRPCTASSCTEVPEGVLSLEGPYPTVLIVHGGASNRQLHWWAAQSLAEAGYMTVAFDVAENTGGDHATDAQDVTDWIFSAEFPFAADLNEDRVGIAGHSQGASTASLLGQMDPRFKAIVSWDNLTAIKSGWQDDLGVDPPDDVVISRPNLGIGADYYFTPKPYTAAPEPAPSNGEGGRGRGVSTHPKDLGYQEVRDAGVDTMLFILRAGTHLDFTPPTRGPGSRYGQAVSMYLTLAWFDRYLRGLDDPALAVDAFHRLLGTTTFDDSADVHNIGAGLFDPMAGNQAIQLAGLSICDRMSFYFKSRYSLRAPGSDALMNSEDLRSDCYAGKVLTVPAIDDGNSGPGEPINDGNRLTGEAGRFGGGALSLWLLIWMLAAAGGNRRRR